MDYGTFYADGFSWRTLLGIWSVWRCTGKGTKPMGPTNRIYNTVSVCSLGDRFMVKGSPFSHSVSPREFGPYAIYLFVMRIMYISGKPKTGVCKYVLTCLLRLFLRICDLIRFGIRRITWLLEPPGGRFFAGGASFARFFLQAGEYGPSVMGKRDKVP